MAESANYFTNYLTQKIMNIDFEKIAEELLKKGKTQEELFGQEGIFKQLMKAVLERAMNTELTHHLGYEKHAKQNSENARNGYSKKTLKGEHGKFEIDVPRDRNSSFEPLIIPKGETRFNGFDDKIIAMYARGLSTRDMQEQLKELYHVDVSPTLISQVTDAIIDEVKTWQNRPLDKVYPILYLDALMVKIRTDRGIINKAVNLALGVNMGGNKDLLGIWISENEGSKFWLNILTELRNRGLSDIFIACVDGLTGFPEALAAVYPRTTVQLCIVHMVRNSLKYVNWKDRKKLASDLRLVYQASSEEAALDALEQFKRVWDEKYPIISQQWERHWHNILPFFAYPAEIRKAIYTTNAIESLNMTLRKYIKNKRVFPSDEAALKQLYLAIRNVAKRWTMPIQNWGSALMQFSIRFEGRLN